MAENGRARSPTAEEIIAGYIVETPVLENETIQTILRNHTEYEKLRICDIFIEKAANPGDRYTSEVFRIHADGYKTGTADPEKPYLFDFTKHLIVKIPLPRDVALHACERHNFENIIPELSERLTKNYTFPVPKFYDADDNMIIMEDFAESGYLKVDRRRSYQPETLKSCLKELAKLHAASYSMKHNPEKDYDEITKQLSDQLMSESKRERTLEIFKNCFEMAKFRGRQNNFGVPKEDESEEVTNIRKFLELDVNEIFERAYDEINEVDEELAVIIHGDFWQNNIMSTTGNTGNIKIIDLANMCKSNLVRDLIYIFATNPMMTPERNQHLESYMEYLHFFLFHLDVPPKVPRKFTIDLLEGEVRRLRYFEFFVTIILAMPTQFTSIPKVEDVVTLSMEDSHPILAQHLGAGYDLRIRYAIAKFYEFVDLMDVE